MKRESLFCQHLFANHTLDYHMRDLCSVNVRRVAERGVAGCADASVTPEPFLADWCPCLYNTELMPTYEYRCLKCKKHFDYTQTMSSKALTKCIHCKGKVERLIGTGSGLIFKGSGFYQTDYKRTQVAPSTDSSAAAPEKSASSTKPEKKEKTESPKPKEKKNAGD